MSCFWYVSDWEIKIYDGQKVDWENSVLVYASSPSAALTKTREYRRGWLERVSVIHGGENIEVIV